MTPITENLPGYSVDIVDQTSAGNTATDTATAFVLGFTESGPLDPTRIRSLAEYVEVFGDRVAYGFVYDTLDIAFREGLSQAVVVRVIGPAGDEEDDDHAAATDTQWGQALAKLTPDYGPGQVAMPGRTTTAAHLQIATHCAANYRNGILDLDNTAVVADLTSDAAAVTGTDGDRYVAAFGPWAVVSGVTAGTTRTVPYSAIQLGLIARVQTLNGGNANVAAAGERYPSKTALSLSQDAFTDSQRTTLNAAGVNVARVISGNVVTYGYRSLADPDDDAEWLQFSGSRELCALAHEAGAVIRKFVFEQIDGRGLKIAEMGGLVTGVCSRHFALDALYGETSEEAFTVDTGPAVNTPTSLAAGQLKAAISARTSPFAEQVALTITHVNSAQAL